MFKKVLIIAALSCGLTSALAHAVESKGLDVLVVEDHREAINIVDIGIDDIKLIKLDEFNVNSIEVFDYGGELVKQVNSNKLTYRESNVLVANFAKEQNQNFERQRLAF